ncbi:MAG: hypothetical protein HYS16_00140 [Deltaproteobacteria bacterium]|nr:MAG: hypothetical protein HYS16_00140 [Deltaproteobacteria bacterium]
MRVLKFNHVLVGLSIIFMFGAYFFPIWQIRLAAPQYPEGLGMEIWLNKIVGVGEFDLQNINLLNHYIGMATINEHNISELQYMPYMVFALMFFSFIILCIDRSFALNLLFKGLLAIGLVGVFDFWYWEYSYGHNLNPKASIKIPGMTYQPPFLGCENLLNIVACSYPGIGFILIGLAGFCIFIAVFKQKIVEILKSTAEKELEEIVE